MCVLRVGMATSIFSDDLDFLNAQIAAVRAQITAYQTGITALSSGVESYLLDTGQSQVRVNRSDTWKLQRGLDALLNRYAMLIRQRDGGGSSLNGAAW